MKRTTLITAAAIGAVLLTSGAAIAANLGILSATEQNNLGTLSATGSAVSAQDASLDIADPITVPDAPAADARIGKATYSIGPAGTLTVSRTADAVRLDGVSPTTGWSWTQVAAGPGAVRVELTFGATTYEFTATPAPGGAIDAAVIDTSDVPGSTASTGDGGGHDRRDGDHEEEEHEGRDDDD